MDKQNGQKYQDETIRIGKKKLSARNTLLKCRHSIQLRDGKKTYHVNTNEKKHEVVILISNKADFRINNIIRIKRVI